MSSKQFSLNKEDAKNILKVLAWTVLSAGLASAIQLLGILESPENLTWLIPSLNILLVSFKKWVDSNK